MRITCPNCGDRDLREFTYRGHALAVSRPSEDAGPEDWDDYLHNRDNPAGTTEDLWYHDPCGTWFICERDTTSHAIHSTRFASGGET